MTTNRLLSAVEVMERLGCCRTFLTDHAAELGGRKVGSRLKFVPADVDAYLDRQRVKDRAHVVPVRAPVQARKSLHLVGKGAINPVSGRPWRSEASR